jgi:hypothetical protein
MENDNAFLKLLQDSSVQIIGWGLGAIGWIIGIVSGIIQVKSYREQKKMEVAYRDILDQAKLDWEGKYTEEQIADLTKELNRLQESINKDIPSAAQRIFLKEQLEDISEDIGRLYARHTEISGSLKNSHEISSIDPNISKAIEGLIMPDYLIRHRQQRRTYILLLLLLLITILPFSIPYFLVEGLRYISIFEIRLFWFLQFALLVFVISYALDKLLRKRFDRLDKMTLPKRIAINFLCWGITIFLILWLGLFAQNWTNHQETRVIVLSLRIVFAVIVAFMISISIKLSTNLIRSSNWGATKKISV